VKAARRTSTLVSPAAMSPPSSNVGPKPALDMHALFGAKPQQNGTSSATSPPPLGQSPSGGTPSMHDRRQSMNQGPGGFQYPNGLPTSNSHPYQMSGMAPRRDGLRPPGPGALPGQPRSPVIGQTGVYNGLSQVQQGFRPPQQGQPGMIQVNGSQQGQSRSNGPPSGMMGRPMMMGQQGMGAYGMHPGPQGPYSMMGYNQPGYNVSLVHCPPLTDSRAITIHSNLVWPLNGHPNNILRISPDSTCPFHLAPDKRHSLVRFNPRPRRMPAVCQVAAVQVLSQLHRVDPRAS